MKFRKVILCGSRLEPLIRYVARMDDGTLVVRNERSYQEWESGGAADDWIGWPNHDVYKYDEKTFKKLKTLFERGMKSEIEKAWFYIKKVGLVLS